MPSRRRRPPASLPPFLRRRSTLWLVAALITLAVGLGLGAIANRGGDGEDGGTDAPATVAATPTLAVALPDIAPDPALLERAQVVRIIDGDTIDVLIDGAQERVRYYGVDTPERGDDCFGEATDRNEALAGETVLLLPDARERDRYDRLLRYVFTADGQSVEERLIAEGLGLAWREDGAYRDTLVALEGEAQAAGAGCLWGG